MQIEDQAKNIKSRDDFIAFVRTLQRELQQKPDSWNNKDLAGFLDALAAWTEDMDGYYLNQRKNVPEKVPWSVFADILMGAKVYE